MNKPELSTEELCDIYESIDNASVNARKLKNLLFRVIKERAMHNANIWNKEQIIEFAMLLVSSNNYSITESQVRNLFDKLNVQLINAQN